MRAMSWWIVLCGVMTVAVATACNGGSEENGGGTTEPTGSTATTTATATATPTATATASPTAEEEILAAYHEYWDVYSSALLQLDPAGLGAVMTGPRLERALNEIDSLRAEERAVRIEVELAPAVIDVSVDQAAVVDQYRNVSVLVDPVTKEPIGEAGEGEGEVLRDIFTLVRDEGRWKVADTVRQVIQE